MIYLDNHATTPCDPRVVDAMLPWFTKNFGNPHSSSHEFGRTAARGIDKAVEQIAHCLNVAPESVLMTSGATESNNLAIRGVCLHPRQKRRHIVTVTTEHPAVLDVCTDLQDAGFRVSHVPVLQTGDSHAGVVDLDQLSSAVDDDTALVTVMWANNEIGAIAPMKQIAEICHAKGALLHSDATQAVGRIPVDTKDTDIDLLSATAHKMYGPKGVGVLVVGNGARRVRLKPQIIGGGQQKNIRSGTLSPPSVIGFATALQLACDEMQASTERVTRLRKLMWDKLSASIDSLEINGPSFESEARLPGNLNLILPAIEGSAWISATPDVAFSAGSACSTAEPKPSHVLTALGLDESKARRSVRFGFGKTTTQQDVVEACDQLIASYDELAVQ